MALREVYARFGVEVEGASKLRNLDQGADRTAKTLERTEKTAKDTGASLMGLASGVAAAFAGNALLGSIRGFADELDTLDDLSTQTGIATDRLQELAYAAELNGSSQTEMFNSLNLLQKSLGKTASAAGPQAEALKKLGIATETASDLNSVLPEVFKGFGNLKNSQEEAAVATALFGRAGVRLLPTLRQGEKGMAALRAELDANGGIVADDTIRKAGEFKDNIARMDRALFALKGNLASAVFPQLSKVVTAIASGVGGLTDWVKHTTLASSGVVALAGTLVGTLGPALAPYLRGGLKFAGIFLAVDEVVAFLQGKDSLIGRVLDAAFGDGAATAVRKWVTDAIGSFSQLSQSGVSIFHAIGQAWGDTLNDMFTAFDEFILSAERMWNDLVGSLHLPDFLKIDTADAENRVASDRAVHDAYTRQAYEEMNPDAVAKTIQGYQNDETGEGENGLGVRARVLKKENIRAAFEEPRKALPGQQSFAREFGLTGGAVPSIENGPRVLATPAQQAAREFLSPPTDSVANKAAPTTNNVSLTQNMTFTGVSREDASYIKDFVGNGGRDGNRAALQILTQRGAK